MISYSTDYMMLADAAKAGLAAFKRDIPAVEAYK